MKAEVLTEWRTRLADRTLITLPAGAVERLLDEREYLLKALKRAWQSHQTAYTEQAIAYADEP